MAAPLARMTPPGDGKRNTVRVPRGTPYTAAQGGFLDVPTFDAHVLSANGWTRLGGDNCFVGPTSARPTSSAGQPLAPNQSFIDTTLGVVVTWRPPAGTTPGAWISTITGAVA